MGKLTIKQKKFADNLLASGNGTQAAIDAGYSSSSRDVARSIASETLAKPDVRAYIQSKSMDAAKRIEDLSIEAQNEAVKLAANKDLLDRAGYKPIDKLEITVPKPLMDNV